MQQLVATYKELIAQKEIDIKENTCINLIIWFLHNQQIHSYILSINEAKVILIEPILLPQLQGLIRSYPDKMILWQDIKSEIELLNNLPRHRGREKKQRALELAKKLPLLSDFLQTSILLLKEYMNITQLLFQYMNAHVEPLEDAALQYFDVLFEKQNKTIIKKTFTPKTSGDQLGRKLIRPLLGFKPPPFRRVAFS